MSSHIAKIRPVIHETVRFWQDALFRLNLGKCHQSRLEYSARALKQVAHCHDMAPPQTLGELCMELAQEAMLEKQEAGITEYSIGIVKKEWTWPYNDSLPPDEWAKSMYELCRLRVSRRDIQAIRRALYRKHTDPRKERLYQLIDKIRNA